MEANYLNFGYNEQIKSYVFSNFGVRNGKIYQFNNKDFMNLNDNLKIRTYRDKPLFDLNINEKILNKNKVLSNEIIENIYSLFGEKGIIAIVYWFGSLFAEQIRDKYQTFPFLEISGELSTGKTTLIEFLWKLLGLNNKTGIETKYFLKKSVWKDISKISNIPTVIIDDGSKKIDWNRFESLYHGKNLFKDLPFKSSLVFSNENPIKNELKIQEKTISLNLNSSSKNILTNYFLNELAELDNSELSRFLIFSLKNENFVLSNFKNQFLNIEKTLKETYKNSNQNWIKNYSQILILLESFSTIFDIDNKTIENTKEYIFNQESLEEVTNG